MEFSGSYNRDMETKQRMIGSNILPVQENNAKGGNYRREMQYGIGHDGREMSRAGGEEQRDRSPMVRSQTSHSIFLLQRKKNVALKVFITADKTFDDKNIGGGFNSSNEAMAARDVVDDAFDNLCAIHG